MLHFISAGTYFYHNILLQICFAQLCLIFIHLWPGSSFGSLMKRQKKRRASRKDFHLRFFLFDIKAKISCGFVNWRPGSICFLMPPPAYAQSDLPFGKIPNHWGGIRPPCINGAVHRGKSFLRQSYKHGDHRKQLHFDRFFGSHPVVFHLAFPAKNPVLIS